MNMKKTAILFYIMVVFFVSISEYSFASIYSLVKEGNKYFQQRDYSAAEEKYKQALKDAPESDIINFDLGTALYKKGDYQQAIEHLQKALLGEDVELKQKALYNLGNAFYKTGIIQQDRNIDSAIEDLKKSLSYYKQALKINNEDEDAQYNYKFVEKELKRLQKKREEQKKQQKQNKQCPLKKKQKRDNTEGKRGSEKKQSQKNNKEKKGGNTQKNNSSKQNESGRENNKAQNREENKQNKNKKGKEKKLNQTQKGNDQNSVSGGIGNREKEKVYNSADINKSTYGNTSDFDKTKAEMLLKKYQQTEAPKGLLNFYKGRRDFTPVLKDW